jgi:hypothetical protein
MAQVVYRGTAYDTIKRRQAKAQSSTPTTVVESYRGIKFQKEVKV